MSYADLVFKENCREIIENGFSDEGFDVRPHWADGAPAHTVKKFGVVNRYDLSKEFPIMTLRKVFFKSCIDELLWIWSKKSNDIHELKSHIWDSWADENGTIGKAYGYQDRMLYDLRHNPTSRRIMSNIYNHHDLHEMGLYPCAYSVTLNVTGRKLNMILNQRSQDMLVANNWNVCQYAILLHMFARSTGFEVGELVHVIADAHIYDRHIDAVRRIIELEPFDAPKLWINTEKKDFYDFTVDDFKLIDYRFHEFSEKIPVAI